MISNLNTRPLNILVAEDQETDAFFIQQAFSKSSVQNQVFWVKDGYEAMEFLENSDSGSDNPRPDLIFLDIKMPRKDGHETLSDIKSHSDFKSIPVIMMSGSQAHDDIFKSYANYANAYVSKSNGFEDMLDFVEAIEKFWFLKAQLPSRSNV